MLLSTSSVLLLLVPGHFLYHLPSHVCLPSPVLFSTSTSPATPMTWPFSCPSSTDVPLSAHSSSPVLIHFDAPLLSNPAPVARLLVQIIPSLVDLIFLAPVPADPLLQSVFSFYHPHSTFCLSCIWNSLHLKTCYQEVTETVSWMSRR